MAKKTKTNRNGILPEGLVELFEATFGPARTGRRPRRAAPKPVAAPPAQEASPEPPTGEGGE
jgi:hypothetical protein